MKTLNVIDRWGMRFKHLTDFYIHIIQGSKRICCERGIICFSYTDNGSGFPFRTFLSLIVMNLLGGGGPARVSLMFLVNSLTVIIS